MRVLICTDSFFPGVGGTEAACLGFAKALVDAGCEVLLACPNYKKLKDKQNDSEYNFKVVRLPNLSLTKNDMMVIPSIAIKQKRLMKDFRPDIIQTESVSGMAKTALKLGKKLNVPVVMTVHTKFRDAFTRSAGKFIGNIMCKNIARKLKRADKVISVVDNMKDEIKGYGFKGDVTIIKNGAVLDKNPATPAEKLRVRKSLGIKENEKVMIFVGHMMSFKRVDFLIQAFKHALDKGLNGRLILIGSGADQPKFEHLAKSLGVENKVLFAGQVRDRKKMVSYYHASDLFVMASIFDNDPIVVVEAACCGVPALVVENTGCSNRIINGKNGYTAKNDTAAFGDKMLEVLSTDLSKISLAAMNTVPTTWQDTVNAHLPIYKELIANKQMLKK